MKEECYEICIFGCAFSPYIYIIIAYFYFTFIYQGYGCLPIGYMVR